MKQPEWFAFLKAVNSKIRNCEDLTAVLKKIITAEDTRKVTKTKDSVQMSVFELLTDETKKKMNPFTFWSFIVAVTEDLETLKKRLSALCNIWEIKEDFHKFAEVRRTVYSFFSFEGWLQNIDDISDEQQEACSKLFNLLIDNENIDNVNMEEFSGFCNKIMKINGIKTGAIRNAIRFIRPDIFVSDSLKIFEYPDYFDSAARAYLAEYSNSKSPKSYRQHVISDGKLQIHYEFICGGAESMPSDDDKFKIFTEFHVEPRSRDIDVADFRKKISSYPQLKVRNWGIYGGFAARFGETAVIDENGGLRDIDIVRKELDEQKTMLVSLLDRIAEQYINDCGASWKNEEKIELLLASKQIIMTGAPGTGKTYTAMKIAEELITANGGTMDKNYCKVQFHSGYDYSDFIIGLKPKVVEGQVVFKWQDGVFKKFADRAKYELDKPYIFVIDEINRADLSRVFGEVFSLLEAEYRKDGITLPNGAKFTLPDNLYIIGTMNDIDRSVESMDFALRRRFSWIEVTAEESDIIIKNKISDTEIQNKLISVMRTLNEYIGGKDIDGINLNLGDEYKLGGAYFVNYLKYDDEPYTMLWENHIAVILNEYLRGSRKRKEIISALYSEYKKVLGI